LLLDFMNVLKRVTTLATAVAVSAGFIAMPSAARAADPFVIDAILSVTGSAAFLGKAQVEALGAIEKTVNATGGIRGRQIHFAVADDQSNPQIGVQLMNAVVAKKAPIVLGSSIAAVCGAIAPLAVNGPVLYCLSPALHPPEGSYAFSAEPSTHDTLVASAIYFRARGLHKIAIITSSDATGQDGEREIDATFPASDGFQIMDREHFNGSDVSVAAQMTRVKGSGAQALIAWTTGTPLGTILRGANDAGLTIPIETTNGNITYAQMKQYAGFMPSELLFPGEAAFSLNQLPRGGVKRRVQEWYDAFKAIGITPDGGFVAAWDPALLLLDGYRKLGFGATAAQIRDYLSTTQNWPGINGNYDFKAVPQRGVGAGVVTMIRWDAGKNAWIGESKPGGEPLK
jgi:branched-chain amino acid transport system substrate-binding protein